MQDADFATLMQVDNVITRTSHYGSITMNGTGYIYT
jgi:hypothetical protein